MSWFIDNFLSLDASKNIIIVGGTHGAGKSTLCKELKSQLKWDYLSPQEIENKDNSVSKENIYKLLLKAVREKISLGESFIYEHIMSGNFVGKLLKESELVGFKCHMIFLDIKSPELSLQRVKMRVKDGGHGVGFEQISTKLTESRRNFWEKYKEKSCSWVLFDNSLNQRRVVSHFDRELGLKIVLEKEHEAFMNNVQV